MHSVVSDNLGNWLGYDSLVAEVGNQAQVFNLDQPLQLHQNDDDPAAKVEEINVDDFNEKQYCLMYWRCDEGKGDTLMDVTDNEMNGDMAGAEWSDEKLEDG